MSAASNIGLYGRESLQGEPQGVVGPTPDERWYAVFTVPKHEKSALRYLDMRGVETFLPTYQVARLWKNRQRVKLTVPLFPCYLFVRARSSDCGRVRQCPGVIRLIGNQRGPSPVPSSAIELLRASVAEKKIQPYSELAVGTRVRVKNGPMQGVEGMLIRKNNALRFVLSIELINQHAAIEMDAHNLEPIPDRSRQCGSDRNFCGEEAEGRLPVV